MCWCIILWSSRDRYGPFQAFMELHENSKKIVAREKKIKEKRAKINMMYSRQIYCDQDRTGQGRNSFLFFYFLLSSLFLMKRMSSQRWCWYCFLFFFLKPCPPSLSSSERSKKHRKVINEYHLIFLFAASLKIVGNQVVNISFGSEAISTTKSNNPSSCN